MCFILHCLSSIYIPINLLRHYLIYILCTFLKLLLLLFIFSRIKLAFANV